MKEQICDINQLYKNATSDFNEVEYLYNVSRLRYEFRDFMNRKGVINLASEGRQDYYMLTGSTEHREQNCFPDQCTRIDKNGAITVEFENGAPCKFYTPYGMIPVHDCNHTYFGTESFSRFNQNKFEKQLIEKYGLIQVGGDKNKPVYAITKIPEIKKSILPWKRKQVAFLAKTLPMPSVSYRTYRPESDRAIDYDLAKNPEYYENYYKDKQYFMPEFAREKSHLQKVFDVVNTKCFQDNRSEYIMPQTGNQPRINGIRYNLKYYLKKVPNAYEKFQNALKEDNAINEAMTTSIKEEYKGKEIHASHIDKEPTSEIIDLGREM